MSGFRRQTRRWMITRLEMVVALIAVGLAIAAPSVLPLYGPISGGVPFLPIVELVGVGGTIVGAVQVFRIARRNPESGRPSWRYRAV